MKSEKVFFILMKNCISHLIARLLPSAADIQAKQKQPLRWRYVMCVVNLQIVWFKAVYCWIVLTVVLNK
jgi:hypothetical protein